MPDKLKHAILGVGGVGGLIGASLAQLGGSANSSCEMFPGGGVHIPGRLSTQ